MRRQQQPLTYSRRMSMTYTLNSDIHLRPLPMPLPKPSASKSLVHSNHVKIASWVRPSIAQLTKRLCLVQKFWEKGLSLISTPLLLHLLVISVIGYLSWMTVATIMEFLSEKDILFSGQYGNLN